MQPTIRSEQIEAWVKKHFEYHRRKSGRELTICNPFDGDTKFKFNINTVKGVCHDWRPGHQHHDGPFIRFVQKYRRISFFEALREVCGESVDLRSILHPKKTDEIDQTPDIPDITLPQNAKPFRLSDDSTIRQIAQAYLDKRGITCEMACRHDLHYNADKIYFPYYEYGIQVYWQARCIHSKVFEFPSLEGAGVGKENFLYGFDNVEPGGILFITESIIDAITLGDGATASGGATMSSAQAKKIRALNPSLIVLAPDRDREGVLSILGNVSLIESTTCAEIRCVVPPKPFKDWNEMWRDNPRQWADNNTVPAIAVNVDRIHRTI